MVDCAAVCDMGVAQSRLDREKPHQTERTMLCFPQLAIAQFTSTVMGRCSQKAKRVLPVAQRRKQKVCQGEKSKPSYQADAVSAP